MVRLCRTIQHHSRCACYVLESPVGSARQEEDSEDRAGVVVQDLADSWDVASCEAGYDLQCAALGSYLYLNQGRCRCQSYEYVYSMDIQCSRQ